MEKLIKVFICGLPDNPITGQKQLLELYLELLRMNSSRVTNERIRERLEVWRSNANLKRASSFIKRNRMNYVSS